MREMMLKYCGPTYPKIQLILANIEKDAKAWTLTLCGDDQISLFEVSKNFQKYVVNINNRKCSCRKWKLTEISCCHAVACL